MNNFGYKMTEAQSKELMQILKNDILTRFSLTHLNKRLIYDFACGYHLKAVKTKLISFCGYLMTKAQKKKLEKILQKDVIDKCESIENFAIKNFLSKDYEETPEITQNKKPFCGYYMTDEQITMLDKLLSTDIMQRPAIESLVNYDLIRAYAFENQLDLEQPDRIITITGEITSS